MLLGEHEAHLKGILVSQDMLVHDIAPQLDEHDPIQCVDVPDPVQTTGQAHAL